MELAFSVSGRIAKPVAEVFEAVADPAKLSRYFTTGGARGRMEKGATVFWSFHDFPGEFPVRITDAVANEKLVFQWAANEGPDAAYDTTVTFRFEGLDDGRTLVTVTEEGWRETPGGLKASYGNCQGWMQMLCCLKAWMEHGINLREGMFT